jgi:actin-related protein
MSLYAAGRTTGLVCNSGDDVSHTTPVFEGFLIPHAVKKMDIAGRVLTDYMQKLLQESGKSFTSCDEMEIVRDIKETLCFVAENYENQDRAAHSSSDKDKTYVMPDN